MLLRHFQIQCFGLKYLSGSWGKQPKQKSPSLSQDTFLALPGRSQGVSMPAKKVWALKHVLSLSLGLFLAGHAPNPS